MLPGSNDEDASATGNEFDMIYHVYLRRCEIVCRARQIRAIYKQLLLVFF